jgi:hypothetical protein
MRKLYHRTLRGDPPPIWSDVSVAWSSLTNTSLTINFETLFRDITRHFQQNPGEFINKIRKSHHVPRGLPPDFDTLPIDAKSWHIFGHFRFIFTFEELDRFVKQPNFQPDFFRSHFSSDTRTLFHSVTHLYQTLLYSLKDTPLFAKHAPGLAFLFGKLLLPDGHRHLDSTSFRAEYVFISPVLVTREATTKKPMICLVDPTGTIFLNDPGTNENLITINQDLLIGVTEGDKILFYDDAMTPIIEVFFPSVSAAYDAFTFSLNPPGAGFMQLSAFLHSVAAFETFSSFFPAPLAEQLPEVFLRGIRRVLSNSTMEVMLYSFSLPSNESKVDQNNLGFFLDFIGDLILPFLRGLTQLRWEAAPYGGQLIMRENSQFTVLCRILLKTFACEFTEAALKEVRRCLEEGCSKIKGVPISDDADALAFIEVVFDPFVQFVIKAVPTIPKLCRILHRLIFVRTSGFYVGQNASYLVIPNLFFLRYLIPPIVEESMTHMPDPKMKKIASLLTGSLLSMCNQLGWPADKEPYMVKFLDRMEKNYPLISDFTFNLIDCHEFDGLDREKFVTKGNTIELIAQAAKRVILMNHKEPNRYIHSHLYSVSLMHLVEEFVYVYVAPAA